ncbi:MAG: peptidoglycan bridge formation glycyltransferase FemA/FemB family protein [Pseudomonadota bacterium]
MSSLRKTSPRGLEDQALRPSQSARLYAALDAAQAPFPLAENVQAQWEPETGAFRSEWESVFAGAAFAAYQQSYAYGEAVNAAGGKILRARIISDDSLVGFAQAVRHMTYPFLPAIHVMRGPVWARPDLSRVVKLAAAQALHQSAPAKGPHAVLITPAEGDDFEGSDFKQIYTGSHTSLLDLSRDEEALRAGLDGKWRNRLNAAEKADITVMRLGRDRAKYAWLLDKDATLMRSIGHRSSNVVLVPAYQSIAGKKSVLAFEAKSGAERIGGMLFVIHGDGATYHIGWSNETGKSLNAQNRIMWLAIRELKKLGVRTLDLGGVDTQNMPGVARFKLGLGGAVVSTSGSWTRGPKWG